MSQNLLTALVEAKVSAVPHLALKPTMRSVCHAGACTPVGPLANACFCAQEAGH